MTAVLAQYLSSNQDQEMNVNEKQSAQLLKESRYPNCFHILLTTYLQRFLLYITDSPSVQIQQKIKILLQYTNFCLLTSAIKVSIIGR